MTTAAKITQADANHPKCSFLASTTAPTKPNVKRASTMNSSLVTKASSSMRFFERFITVSAARPNDPSSATRRTGRYDCNRDAPAGFAAAHGLAVINIQSAVGSIIISPSHRAEQRRHSQNIRYAGPSATGTLRSVSRLPHCGQRKPRASPNTTMPTTDATSGQGDDSKPAATTPARNANKPSANAHHGPLGNGRTSAIRG